MNHSTASPNKDITRQIAIIGMACRFPQADNPAEFWSNLVAGRSAIREVPAGRWSPADYYDPTPGRPGKSITKWGSFLDDVRGFDAAFFRIPPAEARIMDPQHRILLELAHECLESAGYSSDRRSDLRVGVFIAISQSGYEEFTRPLLFGSQPTPASMLANNLRKIAAGRIAHTLNLA
jgi:acyl transferase domain-containing protein